MIDIFLEFVNKFLGRPPLLLGTVTLIGYLLLKQPKKALPGFIKAYVGFRILQVGAGGLVGTFRPIIDSVRGRFGVSALVIDPYFGQTSATEALEIFNSVQFVGYVMIIGFLFNILLVAFRNITKIRVLFITGHIMYQQAAVLLWATYWVILGGTGQPASPLIWIVSGVLIGTYWSVASNLTVEATQHVTNGAGFSLGHQQMFGAWFAYKLGKLVGGNSKDVNEGESKGIGAILNDNIVANTILMTFFVGIIMVILGSDSFAYNRNDFYFVTFIFETTALFAVYIAVLQMGVRMFVAELTASFHGISDKLLKGSVPAVDCAVTFGFSPNAPSFGFMFGFMGQMIAILTLIFIGSPIVILAGFITLFFDNGTIAVYANASGGRRAAAILPFLSGLIQVFGSAAVLTVLVESPALVGWMGMFDWATLWAGTILLTDVAGIIVPIVLIPLLLIIPQIQYRRNPANYFTTMRTDQ
jgi:PTS system ascorbate-specific IIC component